MAFQLKRICWVWCPDGSGALTECETRMLLLYFQCNWWTQMLPVVPGKLGIAVNHTSNPTSHTIWLEGRSYVIYEYEKQKVRMDLCFRLSFLLPLLHNIKTSNGLGWDEWAAIGYHYYSVNVPNSLCGLGKPMNASECLWWTRIWLHDLDMNASMLQEKYEECDVEAVYSYLLLNWLAERSL